MFISNKVVKMNVTKNLALLLKYSLLNLPMASNQYSIAPDRKVRKRNKTCYYNTTTTKTDAIEYKVQSKQWFVRHMRKP